MADLIRVGLVLDSSEAKRGVEQFARSLDQAKNDTINFSDVVLKRLERNYRLGALSSKEYGDALRQLKANIQELSAAGEGAEADLGQLAATTQRADAQLRALENHSLRTTNALRTMSVGMVGFASAAQGGISGVSSFAAGLASLGRGSAYIQGAVLGLVAVAEIWTLIKRNADDARKAQERAFATTSVEEFEGRLALARNRLSNFPASSGTDRFGEPIQASVTIGGRSYNKRQLEAYIADMERMLAIAQGAGRFDTPLPGGPRNPLRNFRAPGGRFGDADTLFNALNTPALGGTAFSPTVGKFENSFGQSAVDKEKARQRAILAAQTERLQRYGREADDAAREDERRWARVGTQIYDSLTNAFAGVLLGQRNAFAAFFSWVEQELARLAARQVVRAGIGAIADLVLPGSGFLTGLSTQAPLAGASPGGITLNLVSSSTREVQRSMSYEIARDAKRGGVVNLPGVLMLPTVSR